MRATRCLCLHKFCVLDCATSTAPEDLTRNTNEHQQKPVPKLEQTWPGREVLERQKLTDTDKERQRETHTETERRVVMTIYLLVAWQMSPSGTQATHKQTTSLTLMNTPKPREHLPHRVQFFELSQQQQSQLISLLTSTERERESKSDRAGENEKRERERETERARECV